MLILKSIHVICAYATGLGFLFRGILILNHSSIAGHKLSRVLPHVIDTCLLLSGLTMLYLWSISPLEHQWLLAKIVALFIYILFGLLMIRWGTNSRRQWIGLLGGLLTYIYIVGAAHGKSLLSVFGLV